MKTRFFVMAGMLMLALCGSVLAQDSEPNKDTPAEKKQEKKAEKKAEPKKKPAEKKSEIVAIVGGDIHTVTNGIIRRGTILVQDGKILDVGQSIKVPEGAQTIDASGKVISPGFVGINVSGIAIRSAPQGQNKLIDSLNPLDRNIKFALGVGITTGCIELSASRGGFRFGRSEGAPDGEELDSEPDEESMAGRSDQYGGPQDLFPGWETPSEELLSEADLDYGDPNTSLCPCCGLPILPTEPIVAATPAAPRPRKHVALKMSYGDLDSMVVKEQLFFSPSPGALSGSVNRHNWRIQVERARKELEKQAAQKASANDATKSGQTTRRTTTRRRSSSSAELNALIKKDIAMRVRVNTVDEIRDMIALARELDYRLIIEGGIEAWLVASELGQAKVPVIFTPRVRRQPTPGREDESGSSIESTGIFQEAGVPFATSALGSSISMGGLAGRDLTSLPLEAAFAVRGGASNQTALESLTIVPAQMMGIDDRVGSLETGKDADILILTGQPLDYRTYVDTAMVNGKICYERTKDRVYPQPK